MFVHNRSSFEPVLARDELNDAMAALCVSVDVTYALDDAGACRIVPRPTQEPHDPPDIRRHLFWRGCSVTAFGHVRGPARPPYVRVVRLLVGELERQLVVFGPRRWQRSLTGEITPSEPARFDAVPLSWTHAYGGTVRLAPGFLPGTELPHPGGAVPYDLNPTGVGFWIGERNLEAVSLPNIEDPQRLLRAPGERALPVGFAPCPTLHGLRVPGFEADKVDDPFADLTRSFELALRLQHHAPGPLIFNQLSNGEVVTLEGVGAGVLRFAVPPSPVRVVVRADSVRQETRLRARSIHVDADRRIVRVVYGHGYRYHPSQRPHRIDVTSSEGT